MVHESSDEPSISDDGTEWRAGAAKESITPDPSEPHVLYGFRARDNETRDGIENDSDARAVALEDGTGQCLFFVSVEVLFISHEMRAWLEERCQERWKVEPAVCRAGVC